jgi:hypothetical protein
MRTRGVDDDSRGAGGGPIDDAAERGAVGEHLAAAHGGERDTAMQKLRIVISGFGTS